MKKKIIFILIAILAAMMFSTSYAAEDYFTMEHYTDPTAVASVGGDVTLTVKISHDYNSAYVMSNVKVYKGSTVVISFGDIYAGQEVTKSGNLNVLSGETSGVTLTLKYSENGQRQVEKDFTVSFGQVQDAKPSIKFSCNLSKTTGESDDTVVLTYKVENIGDVHIYNLKIEDGAFGTIKTLPVLKTGQNTEAVYTAKINNGFTSVPKVTYTVGETTYKESLDAVEVTAGNPDLDLMVTANKMIIAPGDTVTVSCTISNPGTSDLSSVVVREETAGELFTVDGLKAGETQTLSYDVVVNENTTLRITAVGDNGSEKEWLIQKTLDLVVDESMEALDITIEASASETILEFSQVVSFTIIIENTGNEIYKNLKVTDKDDMVVQEINQLVPGKSQFQVNASVQQSGTYFFKLSVPTKDGGTQYISTTPIDIVITTQDGVDTEGTTQPEPSFTATNFDNDKSEPFVNSKTLLLVLIIFGLMLFAAIISLVNKLRR